MQGASAVLQSRGRIYERERRARKAVSPCENKKAQPRERRAVASEPLHVFVLGGSSRGP